MAQAFRKLQPRHPREGIQTQKPLIGIDSRLGRVILGAPLSRQPNRFVTPELAALSDSQTQLPRQAPL